MKLLLEPLIESHRTQGFDVARPWAKGESIQSVQNARVALQLI